MMTNGDLVGQIFLLCPQMMNSFSFSSLISAFLFSHKLPEVSEHAEMLRDDIAST